MRDLDFPVRAEGVERIHSNSRLKCAACFSSVRQSIFLAFFALFEVVTVIAFVFEKGLIVQFQNGIAYIFEEITIVSDHQQGHLGLDQMPLKPLDHVPNPSGLLARQEREHRVPQ